MKEQCVGSDNASVIQWCAKGYDGPLCSNCADGYARRGLHRSNKCVDCSDAAPTAHIVSLILLIVVLMTTYLSSTGAEKISISTKASFSRDVSSDGK